MSGKGSKEMVCARDFTAHTVYLSRGFFAAAVIALAYKAYALTFDYYFVFDDYPTIIQNFSIKSSPIQSFIGAHSRWLSMVWNSITYHFHGQSPAAFRSENFLLHLANALLLWILTGDLFQRSEDDRYLRRYASVIAGVAAVLFLLHPAQTQTATYITQLRLEGLATLTTLLVLLCFVRGSDAHSPLVRWIWWLCAGIFSWCAAGTKEITIFIPLFCLLADYMFLSGMNLSRSVKNIPGYLSIIIFLYGSFYSYSFSSTVPFSLGHIVRMEAAIDNNRGNILTAALTDKITAWSYFISEFRVMVHYIGIFWWPFSLSFDYDIKLARSFFQFDVIASLFFLLAYLSFVAFLWWSRRAPALCYGLLWFFIAVYPRASIVPSAEMVCDYKTYLGSVGMMIVMAYLFVRALDYLYRFLYQMYDEIRLSTVRWAGFFFLVAVLYNTTVARNDVWSTPLKFWSDVIRKAPRKARAYNNYAVALAESGATDEALEFYKKSIDCDPFYAEPLINLGSHFQAKGDYQMALKYYGKALELKHEPHPECYNNVGLIQYLHKDFKKARSCFKTALLLKNYYGKAHFNLAKVSFEEKGYEEAFREADAAISTDFDQPQAHLLRGKAAVKLGNYREGIKSLEKAVAVGYDFEGIFLLGTAYYNEHDYARAVASFEKTYRRQPQSLVCAYNYAQALMNNKAYAQAIPLFEQCTQDSVRYPFASLHIAKCLAENGNRGAALEKINTLLGGNTPQFVKDDTAIFKKSLLESSLRT
jgi:protein O-mannosyl-transferase